MTENDDTMTAETAPQSGNVVALPSAPQEQPHRKVANFVHEHPFMTVAGGLAVGILAAALVPKRNRTYIAKRTSLLADAVSAASVALAQQAMQRAEAAGSQVRNRADILAERASHLGGSAMDQVGKIGEAAADKAHRVLRRTRPEPTLSDRVASVAGEIKERLHR